MKRCQEETEQVHLGEALGQAGGLVEEGVKWVVIGREQDLQEIVFVQNAARGWLMG